MKLNEIIKNGFDHSISNLNPYIIAEAGVNHEGDLKIAKKLIDQANDGGANAIKFQSYKASSIASKNSPAYWDLSMESTRSQFELFKKYDKFWKKEFEDLANYCESVGIEFLSTPFDKTSANFLNDMMDVYKISSSDLNNEPFIDLICDFKKPILLSTGASYMWEIEQTASWIENKNIPYGLLHCVLNYPTADENANLLAIKEIQQKFPKNVVGYSDHTLPKDMKTLELASLLGAKILEKHFTHDKTLKGNDHYHAMDMYDLQIFHRNIRKINILLGHSNKKPLETEKISRLNARRSIVASKNIKKGDPFSEDNLTYKRPGTGIDPRELNSILGKTASVDIFEDDVLSRNMINT